MLSNHRDILVKIKARAEIIAKYAHEDFVNCREIGRGIIELVEQIENEDDARWRESVERNPGRIRMWA